MALPEIANLRSLSDGEISEQISGTRRELFDLRFQQATSRLENPTVSAMPASSWPSY